MTAEHGEMPRQSSSNAAARPDDTGRSTTSALNRASPDTSNLKFADFTDATNLAATRRAARAFVALLRDREIHHVAPPGDQVSTTRTASTDDDLTDRVFPDSLDSTKTPFISVVLLVGDASLALLSDALVALDAQSDHRFELFVIVDASRSSEIDRIEELLAAFNPRMVGHSWVVREATSPEETSGRIAAIRVGLAQARGRYVTVLDATSVVFGHFIATFADLAKESSVGVLRARALRQPMRELTWPDGCVGFEPTGAATPASSPHFSILDHLRTPQTPPGSYALLREYFDDLESGGDEDEMLLEAALLADVAEATHDVVILLRDFP